MPASVFGLSSVVTTAVFILIFILIGVPIWWRTTEVYRYPIPHEECQNLVNLDVRHVVPVKLILADRSIQQSVLWEKLLLFSEELDIEDSKSAVSFHWTMSTVTEDEEQIIKTSKSISDLDMAFYSTNKASDADKMFKSSGEIKILILNKTSFQSPKFTVGRHEFGYILNDDADTNTLAHDVFLLVKEIAQVSRVVKSRQKRYKPLDADKPQMETTEGLEKRIQSTVELLNETTPSPANENEIIVKPVLKNLLIVLMKIIGVLSYLILLIIILMFIFLIGISILMKFNPQMFARLTQVARKQPAQTTVTPT